MREIKQGTKGKQEEGVRRGHLGRGKGVNIKRCMHIVREEGVSLLAGRLGSECVRFLGSHFV